MDSYLFNRPQNERVAVLHVHPIACNDRVGVGLVVRNLVLCKLFEFLGVGFIDNELSGGSQRHQDGPGVNDAAVTASSTSPTASATTLSRWSGPGNLAVLGIEAEELIALPDTVDHAVLEQRRAELE